MGQDSNLVTEDSTTDKVGFLSHEALEATLVTENSTTDKIGFLSHEALEATSRTGQTAGDEQSVSSGVAVPEKAPNEANLEMTKDTKHQRVKTEKRDSAKRERSQFAAGDRKVQRGRDHRVEATVPAGEGGGEPRGDTSPAVAQTVAENVVPGQQGPPIVATKPGGSQGARSEPWSKRSLVKLASALLLSK